eukprot:g20423.t1
MSEEAPIEAFANLAVAQQPAEEAFDDPIVAQPDRKEVKVLAPTREQLAEGKRCFVEFVPSPISHDKVFSLAGANRVEGVFVRTEIGKEENLVVTIDFDLIVRVFKSWSAAKGFYVKGNQPIYSKIATDERI